MKRGFLLLLFAIAAAGFLALGTWQLQRRIWKVDLIARVDARIHASPVPLPPPAQWPHINATDDEYRHVRLDGRYLNDRSTRVDALTEEGAGAWIVTPLVTDSGTVLINRGFVTPERARDYEQPSGIVSVSGLLRMTEPGGRFLRPNRPLDDAWYSRDVAAIATARKLGRVAPFFVDADAAAVGHYPVGGLTVVQFRNMHLAYALTWFALATLCGTGVVLLLRRKTLD